MRSTAILLLVLALGLAAFCALRPGEASGPGEGLSPSADGEAHTSELTRLATRARARDGQQASPDAAAVRSSGTTRFGGLAEEWLSGEALLGAQFVFKAAQRQARATSDAGGRFSVELDPQAIAAVEVTAPPDYWTYEHEFVEGALEPLYRARFAPNTLGPLRARLVDRITGEPLPEYVARLHGPQGWNETLLTDDEGLLRSGVLFPAGELILRASEEELGEDLAGNILARHEFTPAGAAPALATLAIWCGPTYSLIIDKPANLELDQLRAYLVDASWAAEIAPESEFGQALHAGPPTWVRFSEDHSYTDDARLVLLDAGNRYRGVARVDASPGRHSDPLPIRVEAMARLRGRVVNAQGEGVARAELELNSALEDDRGSSRWSTSNGRGNFAFDGIPAGPYNLSLRHTTQGALDTTLDIVVGAQERRDFELDPFQVGGDVEGVVRSVSGEFQGAGTLLLLPIREESSSALSRRSQRLNWTREGAELVARYKFSGVANAKYELRLSTPREPYLSTPQAIELEPPHGAADFLVQDDREVYYLSFLTVEAGTGDWLRGVQLRIVGAADEELFSGHAGDWRCPRPFAEDEVLSWEARKPGYRTARGDRSAFEAAWSGRQQYATIELRRN